MELKFRMAEIFLSEFGKVVFDIAFVFQIGFDAAIGGT